MVELHSVVVATDLSAPARRAAERAARLAHAASASLTLVYVVSGSALDALRRWLDTNGAEGSILEDASRRLRELVSELGARYEIRAEQRVVTGHVVDQVAGAADEQKADVL